MADIPVAKEPDASAAATQSKDDKKPDEAKASKGGTPSMHVRVASPFKVFYDDEALSLSGVNARGAFDILPHHHNFISLLSECELLVKTQAGVTQVRISGGIMHVKADQVVVFLNV